MTEPLISVVIATYNRAADLDRAIRSSLSQPGDDYEVVVGDDASSDDTPSVVARHSGDRRVRAYRNDRNLGMQQNYWKIARFARGRYLFILTDDDTLLPDALPCLRCAIGRHPEAGYLLSDLPTVDERTGLCVNLHRTFAADTLAPPGLATVERVVPSAWVLSRQTFRRDAVDWETWAKFRQNIFFPIILAGRAILRAPCYYIARPLVSHTWFNIVHWEQFGHDALDIEFNLAANRFACMRSIVHDLSQSEDVERAVATWEIDSFRTYLFQERLGYHDLVRSLGRTQADRRLQAVYPVASPVFASEMRRFWRTISLLRLRWGAKALARLLPSRWLAVARPTRKGA